MAKLTKVATGSIGPDQKPIYDVFQGAEHIQDPNDPRLKGVNIASLPDGTIPTGFQSAFKPVANDPITPVIPGSLDASNVITDSQDLAVLAAKNNALKAKAEADYKASLLPVATAPIAVNLEGKYTGLLSTEGIDTLNANLTAKNQEILKLQDEWRVEKANMEAGTQTTSHIAGAVNKTAADRQATLDSLLREKALMVDELSTKQNIVSNIMDFAKTDYTTAKSDYDTKFSQNLQIQTSLENYKSKEETTANAARDDARANLTTLLGIIKDSGKDWSSFDPQTKLNLQTLENKAGIPAGTISQFIVNHPKSDVISTSTRDFNGTKFTDVVARDPDTGKIFVDSYKMGGVDVSGNSITDEKRTYDLRVAQAPSQVSILAKQGYGWGEIADYLTKLGIDPGMKEIDDALHRQFQSQKDYENWKSLQ